MDYSRNFYRVQVPEWESYYMPYRQLEKQLTEALWANAPPSALPDFLANLERAIKVHDRWCRRQEEHIRLRVAEIKYHSGLDLDTWEPGMAPWRNLSQIQLELMCASVDELEGAAMKMRYYQVKNTAAIAHLHDLVRQRAGLHASNANDTPEQQSDHTTEQFFGKLADVKDRLNALITCLCEESRAGAGQSNEHLETNVDSGEGGQRPRSPLPEATEATESLLRDYQRLENATWMDDASTVVSLVTEKFDRCQLDGEDFLKSAVDFAIYLHAPYTASALFEEVAPRHGFSIDEHLLNRLITVLGYSNERPPWYIAAELPRPKLGESIISILIGNLGPNAVDVLLSKDGSGRSPLHYAAIYGLELVCTSIVKAAESWDKGSVYELYMASDNQGVWPLEYAVAHRHPDAASIIAYSMMEKMSPEDLNEVYPMFGSLARLAILLENDRLVSLMVAICNNYRGWSEVPYPEGSPLHIAVRGGKTAYVTILLNSVFSQFLHTPEPVDGLTPMNIAVSGKHLEVAYLLYEAGVTIDLSRLTF
ncbi:hypothetical protein BO70DRAFT_393686 [Aspergillus heteromorphus CBS 117.55]|uniref:Uncharacterized protein n=1 Tax=Aspergillus heteromorphus CBS 117.55 TaxID=1448321 RepID=A0A317WRU5_9EURO|nr:uncharacterized protein BO70DRAFT_393686 [Aspergillus heteromorphus CBS 117.55]PWY89176.1 hypothetical protein BO70DRAFT_393686 [Aspergillus heteromorphus CBS 117.55]